MPHSFLQNAAHIIVPTVMCLALWLFLLCTGPSVVESLVPPHPSYSDWEPVHDRRRRLNQTWVYEPEHISHEICRYMSEQQCREQDDLIGDAKAGRNGRRLSPSVGQQLQILVLLVKFKNHQGRTLPSREYFEEMFNGGGDAEAGSIKEYFRFSSLGQYRVQFDVRDWFDLPETEAFYSEGRHGLVGGDKLQRMFWPVMDAVDSDIDWFDGYIDSWGLINHVVVLHSGFGAEHGNRKCLQNARPENRIWSQGTAASNDGWLNGDFFMVNGYAMASAIEEPSCSGDQLKPIEPAGMGIIVHEYIHGFGPVDLYDQDQDDSPIALGGTGRFDIMSNAFGWTRSGELPGHMGPFSRINTPGWLDPILIQEDGFYAIQPSEISGQVYKIAHNFPEGEYLLIENRQPIKWDSDFPSNSGIVIYHVDEAADRQKKRGYPGKAGWPKDHYMVSVLQADGNYDLEKGTNLGDEGDFWRAGDVLGSGGAFPNTDSIQGGVRTATGLTISIVSPSSFIMAFQVEGISGNRAPSYRDTDKPLEDVQDPQTTGGVILWMVTLLGGISAMVGLMGVLS